MDTLNRLPWVAQNAVFQRLEEIAEVSAMTKEERIKYDHALKVYRDTLNTYDGAVQKGEQKKAVAIARKLKSMGLSLQDVIKATGLTEEVISKL